jgi:hypothetical protein
MSRIDLQKSWRYPFGLMSPLRRNGFLRVLAFFALLLFSGDLITDAVADLSGSHCVTESSQPGPCHDKAPCAHCSCATHSGTVVVADFEIQLNSVLASPSILQGGDEATPPRLAGSIDHPPQLA